MKKIFICETPMQIIIALAIKEQYISKNAKVDLLISDAFKSSEIIVDRIKKLNIFNNVYGVNVNISSKIKKLKKSYFIVNTKKYLKKELKINDFKYDEMYFWNYDSFSASLRACFYKKNKQLKTFLFEEAYTIYLSYEGIAKNSFIFKLINFKNKIFHNNLVKENIDGLFMLEPKLLIYKPQCPVYKINRDIINSVEFRKKINNIFKANNVVKNYDKKYIIFEEATLANSNEFDDKKLILDIVNKVGKDNVIIKLHPRTNEDRFTKLGIKTLGADGIPWEAITLSGDFSNKVFITISSSAIVNYRLTIGKNMKGILLFKINRPNIKYLDKKYDTFWKNIESKYPEGGIYIPNNYEELNNILDKIIKEGENNAKD